MDEWTTDILARQVIHGHLLVVAAANALGSFEEPFVQFARFREDFLESIKEIREISNTAAAEPIHQRSLDYAVDMLDGIERGLTAVVNRKRR